MLAFGPRIKRRPWMGAIAVGVLLDWASLHGGQGSGAPVRRNPLSIVFAVDTGSSDRFDLDDLREGLRRFVQRLAPTDGTELCSFGDRLQCAPFTRDRRSMIEDIGALREHDDARMFDSLDAAIEDLRSSSGRRVVVVFTMAPDTRWSASPQRVLMDARSVDATVYAVGLDVRYFDGDDLVDGQPDPELEWLVRQTGGKFFEVADDDDIPAAFARLAGELQ